LAQKSSRTNTDARLPKLGISISHFCKFGWRAAARPTQVALIQGAWLLPQKHRLIYVIAISELQYFALAP